MAPAEDPRGPAGAEEGSGGFAPGREGSVTGTDAGRPPALLRGWRLLWRSKRLWIALWLLHLGAGALLAWVFAGAWDGVLGRRLAAAELGGPDTAGVLVDLLNHHPQVLQRVLMPVGLSGLAGGSGSAWVVLGWIWLGAVLAGGVLAQLVRASPGRHPALPEGLDASRAVGPPFVAGFLWDCGWHLARMTRLLLLHLVVLWLSLALTMPLVGGLVLGSLGPAPSPDDETRAGLAVLALAGLVFLFLGLVHDYARVRVVREQRRSVVLSWWKGLGFVFRWLARVVGLQVAFLAVVAALTTLWWLWGPVADAGLLALALAPAAFLLVRAGVRIWWLGSELALFDSAVRGAGSDPSSPDRPGDGFGTPRGAG